MFDYFDRAVALLGIVVAVMLPLLMRSADRRKARIEHLENGMVKVWRVLAVITGDPNIEGSTPIGS